MKALVSGATGFLGSRLVRRMLELGHEVSIVARRTSAYDQIEDLIPQLNIYVADNDPESVRRAVAAAEPDVVLHLATFFARDHESHDLSPMLDANVGFPLQLVDAMAREGRRRLVNTGSAWEFFDGASYRPVCLHSAMKHAFKSLIDYYVDADLIDCITLMMHDSYGPDDPRRKIFALLRDHAGKLEPLRMTAGEQLVDLVYVDDVAAAYVGAAERLREADRVRAHEIFSVSGGNPLPLREAVEMYLSYANCALTIDWGGRPYHEREVLRPWKGQCLPGWRPQVDLATGLRRLAVAQAKPKPRYDSDTA